MTVTVPGGDARHAGEQFTYASVLFFQEMSPYLHRDPSRNFAHGGEEWKAAIIILYGLIGEGGYAVLEERLGEARVCGEVQIGEEDDARPEHFVLGLDGLLYLDHHVRRPEYVLGISDHGRALASILLVGKAASCTGPAFNEHFVRASGKSGNAGRRQGDAVFLVFCLFGHADDHMSPVHDLIRRRPGDRRGPGLILRTRCHTESSLRHKHSVTDQQCSPIILPIGGSGQSLTGPGAEPRLISSFLIWDKLSVLF